MLVRSLWLCALVLVISCAPPPAARRAWQPSEGMPALWNLLEGEWAALDNVTAEAAVEFEQDGVRERATAVVQVKGSSLYRIEVRGPFYSHVFTAVQQGDSLTVYGPAVGGAWKGSARGHLLHQITGIDLGMYSLGRALLGWVDPVVEENMRKVEYPRADRATVISAEDEIERHLELDVHRGVLLREHIYAPGQRLLLRRFMSDYRRVGAALLPQRVEIEQGAVRIALHYQNYDLRRPLRAEDFENGIPHESVVRLPD